MTQMKDEREGFVIGHGLMWGVNSELLIIKIDCSERWLVPANLQGLHRSNRRNIDRAAIRNNS